MKNLREHDLNNVTLIEGDSLKVVPALSQTFDIVFIDGNHAYEYVLADALNSWRLLAPDGFCVFHDYHCVEETTRAVGDFSARTGARLVEMASSLVVTRKSIKADDQRRDQHPKVGGATEGGPWWRLLGERLSRFGAPRE